MTQELIEKFYSDNCSEEEKQYIINYFQENPNELEVYFSEEEWNQFTIAGKLDTNISARILKTIQQQMHGRAKVLSILKRVAVAASVLLVIGLGWNYLLKNKEVQKVARAEINKIVDTTNTTSSVIKLILPDSSLVLLEKGSELKFPVDFDSSRRDVDLVGVAFFKVAKDASKPFTVFSDEIATTALGTEFQVTALNNADNINVKLFEGKIVIKSSGRGSKKLDKNFYLHAGEEFNLNRKTMVGEVLKFDSAASGAAIISFQNSNNVLKGNNWYMFNNQNLPEVLDQLATMYHVKIEYKRSEVDGINFIGKIDNKDSITRILKDIAELNQLEITQKGNTYFIKKE